MGPVSSSLGVVDEEVQSMASFYPTDEPRRFLSTWMEGVAADASGIRSLGVVVEDEDDNGGCRSTTVTSCMWDKQCYYTDS
jgi:hypothetical protein